MHFLIFILKFQNYSREGSYLSNLHIKPYYYCCSYSNGILAGYLIASARWKKLREDYSKQIENMIMMSRIICFILTSILLTQTVIFDLLPTISAFEASLMPSLMSFQFCIIILDNSIYNIINHIFSFPIWYEIRKLIRVSYVFHPLIFKFISLKFPLKNDNLINFILNMYIIFLINFSICKIIQIKIEKPLIICSEMISNSNIFHI